MILSTAWPTLLDAARLSGPDGKPAEVGVAVPADEATPFNAFDAHPQFFIDLVRACSRASHGAPLRALGTRASVRSRVTPTFPSEIGLSRSSEHSQERGVKIRGGG